MWKLWWICRILFLNNKCATKKKLLKNGVHWKKRAMSYRRTKKKEEVNRLFANHVEINGNSMFKYADESDEQKKCWMRMFRRIQKTNAKRRLNVDRQCGLKCIHCVTALHMMTNDAVAVGYVMSNAPCKNSTRVCTSAKAFSSVFFFCSIAKSEIFHFAPWDAIRHEYVHINANQSSDLF